MEVMAAKIRVVANTISAAVMFSQLLQRGIQVGRLLLSKKNLSAHVISLLLANSLVVLRQRWDSFLSFGSSKLITSS